MTRVLFDLDQLIPAPWKNGGGVTREIVRIPADSRIDDFTWRASLAELSVNGPFSAFVGVDRVIVLLSGSGVHLRSSDGSVDHRLDAPLEPFNFAGECAISAQLIAGASSDFNVMTRRGCARAEVRIIRGVEPLSVSRAGVLFAARGAWSVRTPDATYSLPENSGVWWDDQSTAWALRPKGATGALIAVRVESSPEPIGSSTVTL